MHTAFSVRYELTALHLHFSPQVALLTTQRHDITNRTEREISQQRYLARCWCLCSKHQQRTRKVTEILIFRPPTLFCRLYRLLLIRSKDTKIYVKTCVFLNIKQLHTLGGGASPWVVLLTVGLWLQAVQPEGPMIDQLYQSGLVVSRTEAEVMHAVCCSAAAYFWYIHT
jgi:hypothetical protein